MSSFYLPTSAASNPRPAATRHGAEAQCPEAAALRCSDEPIHVAKLTHVSDRQGWHDGLGDEIAELFGELSCVPETRGLSTSTTKDAGIVVPRQQGRSLESVERRREWQRTVGNVRRKQRAAKAKRRAYESARWRALKDAPLVAVEVGGVIWLRPPAELERHRERARSRRRAA